jgi:CHAT domain-containing protein/tetratricopeptide (TPR) repeat protein
VNEWTIVVRIRAALVTGVLLQATVTLAAAGPSEPLPAPALVPGVQVTFDLAPGAAARHAVSLDAGTFLRCELRDKGQRFTISLLDPGGAVVATRATAAETITSLRLLHVPAASGAYAIDVQGSAATGAGGYDIRCDELRPAGASERALAAADEVLAEGIRLSNTGTADSRRQAAQRLEAAAAAFNESGDRRGEAQALHDRGFVQYALGEPGAADPLERSRALFQALGDRGGEAAALGALGRAHMRGGDFDAAFATFETAVALAQEMGHPRTLAYYTSNAGIALARAGSFEPAIAYFLRSLSLATRSGNVRGQARTLNNVGSASLDLGDIPMALDYYERALTLWRQVGMRDGETMTLNNIGHAHQRQGDDARALPFLEQALALARSATYPDEEGRALTNLASVYQARGDHRRAVELCRESMEIRRKLGDRRGEASNLRILGRSLHGLGEIEPAREQLGQALAIQQSIGDRFLEAQTRTDLVALERDRGDLRAALGHAEAAVTLVDRLRSEVTNPELRALFVAAEQDHYSAYLDVLMRLHEREPDGGHAAAALQASERARARVLLETLIEARADIRQGVDAGLLEQERAVQKRLSAAGDRLGRLLAGTAAEAEVAAARRQVEAVSEEHRHIQIRIRATSPRYASLTQPVPATLLDVQRSVLDDDTVLLEFFLGQQGSVLWAVSRTEMVTRTLPPRAVIEASARLVHELLAERRRSGAGAAGETDRKLANEAKSLSQVLLGGIGPRLATDWKGKRLLIVAGGALAYVPFGALPAPSDPAARPLLMGHEVVFTPSASVLMALRSETPARAAPLSVAVLADPVFEDGDPRVTASTGGGRSARAKATVAAAAPPPPGLTRAMSRFGGPFGRLPFSRFEAQAIGTLVPREALLTATDFAATRRLVLEGALSGRSIVHFATHGLLDSTHPDLSGLVLSLVDEKGGQVDGFLRMNEIYNLRLDADLVVLSACQTALGREIRGEGLQGLTRGFMYAGARSVVASLWKVDDESTAELMKRFYRAMLKEKRRPAEALRQAQLEMARDPRWTAPFYWAGFVLQGEWGMPPFQGRPR